MRKQFIATCCISIVDDVVINYVVAIVSNAISIDYDTLLGICLVINVYAVVDAVTVIYLVITITCACCSFQIS